MTRWSSSPVYSFLERNYLDGKVHKPCESTGTNSPRQACWWGTSCQEDNERKNRKDWADLQSWWGKIRIVYEIQEFYLSCFQEELGYVEDEFEDLKELFKVSRINNENCAHIFKCKYKLNQINHCFAIYKYNYILQINIFHSK